jgi:hypothetical protein
LSTLLAVLLACIALVVPTAAFPVARRMFLQRPVGSFTCSVRLGGAASRKGFSYGVGRYHGDRVEWFEIFSVSPKPRHVFARRDLQLRGRRPARGEEAHGLPASTMVLECAHGGTTLEFAMSPDTLTGFMAWIEAAPPGYPVLRHP